MEMGCRHAYIILLKILWTSFCVISPAAFRNPSIYSTCFFSFSEVLPARIDAKLKCSCSTKAFGSTLPLPSISFSSRWGHSPGSGSYPWGNSPWAVYSLFSCQGFHLLPLLCLPLCNRGILIFCFLPHSPDCLYFLLTCCSVSAGQLTLIP